MRPPPRPPRSDRRIAMSEEQKLIWFGRAIHQAREERALSVGHLASKTGIDSQDLEALEAGRLDPAFDLMFVLAKALGADLPDLFCRAEALEVLAAFGLRLRTLRVAEGISQDTLSRQSGVHPSTVSRLEAGVSDPRLSVILRLSHGIGIPPRELLRGVVI